LRNENPRDLRVENFAHGGWALSPNSKIS
jgi:hypothetical protein